MLSEDAAAVAWKLSVEESGNRLDRAVLWCGLMIMTGEDKARQERHEVQTTRSVMQSM